MWKWTCPGSGIINEHHSWKDLNEVLTAHEEGFTIPGGITFPPCHLEHEYWDDGKPCSVRNCRFKYVRDDEKVPNYVELVD